MSDLTDGKKDEQTVDTGAAGDNGVSPAGETAAAEAAAEARPDAGVVAGAAVSGCGNVRR